MRADHFSVYGYGRETTPALAELGSTALVFERAQASAAVTPVSHASILTGLEPYRHGLRALHGSAQNALAPNRETLAEILGGYGYQTAAWISAFTSSRYYGLEQGFETWDEDFDGGLAEVATDGVVDNGTAQRNARDVVDGALAWLRSRPDPNRPFFVWLHLFDAHDDEIVPPDTIRRRFLSESQTQEDQWIALYDADLYYMDHELSRLFDGLRGLDLFDETLIAVIGDHGEALGERNWWGHTLLFEEQLHVPFLLRSPGRPGQRVSNQVRTTDLVPTLLDLLGLPPRPESFDGQSLLPLLDGSEIGDRPAYSETLQDLAAYRESPFSDEAWFAANDGRWKLILHRTPQGDRFSLFDLSEDPFESQNLAVTFPQEIRRLSRILRPGIKAQPDHSGGPIEAEARSKLESLGYLGNRQERGAPAVDEVP